MTAYKYSTKINENCAKVFGSSLPISRKHSFAICKALRKMALPKAKKYMEAVISKKQAIPFTRFTNGLGHRPGMAAGRYPIKACSHILKLLNSVEANAQFKGLSTANLILKHIVAQKASSVLRSGRQRREAKRTHIEIVVEEIKKKTKTKKSEKKKEQTEKVKTETKKVETKIEKKPEMKTKVEEVKTEIKKEEKPTVKTEEAKKK